MQQGQWVSNTGVAQKADPAGGVLGILAGRILGVFRDPGYYVRLRVGPTRSEVHYLGLCSLSPWIIPPIYDWRHASSGGEVLELWYN